jgi:PAS domain S-box-containing protein
MPEERRRNSRSGQSPMTTLNELPPLMVLDRLPVAALAIEQNGTILFANAAFAAMLGHSVEALLSLKFAQIFQSQPAEESAVAIIRARGGQLVELAHAEGSIVRAKMSGSVLLRGDDPVALATFQDMTEQLWTDER